MRCTCFVLQKMEGKFEVVCRLIIIIIKSCIIKLKQNVFECNIYVLKFIGKFFLLILIIIEKLIKVEN